MKGLLYKEYVILKPQLKSWFSVLAFFILYTIVFRTIYMLFMMMTLLGIMASFNSFHYDKLYRCDEYIGAMPVSRRQMVGAKYIFFFLLDLVLAAISLGLTGIYNAVMGESPMEAMAVVGTLLIVVLMMQTVMFPIVYLLGVDRARYVNMFLWIVPCMVLFWKKEALTAYIQPGQLRSLIWLLPCLLLVLLLCSLPLSITLFRRKDL